MPKKYTIRAGFTFRGDDGEVAGGGDIVELEDDVAQLHAHKLELVEDASKRRKQPTPSADAAGVDPASQEPAGDDTLVDPQ